jgi:putative transcriptional regulator
MRSKAKLFAFIAIAVCLPALFASNDVAGKAQYPAEEGIAAGNILFANEKLSDPNFAQSVILIVQFDSGKGAEGLVLNRRTQVSIVDLFPKAKHASKDPVYIGGPVGVTSAQALLRAPAATDQATRVVGDVYVTGTKELIDKSIESKADPSKFRLYVGYAGWAPGQLQAEIRLGAWSLINGSSKIVFDPQPDSLWSRLMHESKMRLAWADFPNAPPRLPR